MEDDQQFCLRWNNHQSTLIAVFDTLLENGTLVDCTLAAEGKYLNAHKVVLSACSPYFESLLSQNYDKHPIFILKDVKFQELKAMMDYMYRGEVNISQDQLSALLRAAESLQIKGLSDNRGKSSGGGGAGSSATSDAGDHPTPAKKQAVMQQSKQQQLPNKGQGLTITEPRRMNKTEQQQQQQQLPPDDREESVSPVPSRRRKRARRKSTDTEDHLNHHDGASNSSESHQSGSTSAMMTATTTLTTASNKAGTDVPAPIDTKADILAQAAAAQARTNEQPASSSNTVVPNLILKEKQEPAGTSATSASSAASNIISHAEVMLEPKSEYIDDMNEDSIEDLTLDDDDLSNMEGQMEDGAGPSQGHGHGESSQGFGWHMNQGQDEVFMAAQEAVGAHRDSQGPVEPKIRIVSIENLSRKDAQKLLQDESCNKNFPVKIESGTTRQKIIMGQMVNSISKSSFDLTQKPQIKQEIILTPEKDPCQSVATTSTELIITDPIPCTSTITNNPIIHRSVRIPKACNERMKRFFEMTPADLPKTPTRKKYSCEKPILDPPKDRLRCSCGILMERVMMAQHLNTCPKGKIKAQKVYACGGCLFKHSDMAQIDHHVKFCESLKNNKNCQSD